MKVYPLPLACANAFIDALHRHNKPSRGHRFSIGLADDEDCRRMGLWLGVAVVGRPVSRILDDGLTAEVTRLCVAADAPLGSCSMLYRAAWRAWREMGGSRMVTYTLLTESGASLRGAGWQNDGPCQVNAADQWTNRGGNRVSQSAVGDRKQRWSVSRHLR